MGSWFVQRTPNYIAPRNDRPWGQFVQSLFTRLPFLQRILRNQIFDRLERENGPIIHRDPQVSAERAAEFLAPMCRQVDDPGLHEKLPPDYELGCKRLLVSDDFYPTLNRDNVDLVTDGLDHFEKDGIVTSSGARIECDAVVMATGFDLGGHAISIPVFGPSGRNLLLDWIDSVRTYHGAAIAGYPNLHFVTGPNTGVATNSIVYRVEAQLDLILQAMQAAGNDKLITPKAEVQDRYHEALQEKLSKTVWASGCQSWYRPTNGEISTLYPGDARSFLREREQINLDDCELTQIKGDRSS
jgi:cation diffusion facilitator CzcD-associated flavoprotein CzcO